MSRIGAATVAVIAGCAFASQSASASLYTWDWQVGDPGSYSAVNTGGHFETIHAEFDSITEQLVWNVTFSDQITKGFTLAVDDGPNPKGHAGELALVYVDASNMSDPQLSAYAYNGKNMQTSWIDGNGKIVGDQTPDPIFGKDDTSRVLGLTAIDTPDGKRHFSMTIDASFINDHSPMYPDAEDPWFGIGFAERLGLWFHTFTEFEASYGEDGLIDSLELGDQGWFDGTDFPTVPAPGSVVLGGAAMGLIGLRRRR